MGDGCCIIRLTASNSARHTLEAVSWKSHTASPYGQRCAEEAVLSGHSPTDGHRSVGSPNDTRRNRNVKRINVNSSATDVVACHMRGTP